MLPFGSMNDSPLPPPSTTKKKRHIRLTSHPGRGSPGVGASEAPSIKWGQANPLERGPVVGSLTNPAHRNCIGTHSGSYSVYRALAISAGTLDAQHKPDLTNTAPSDPIGPFAAWGDPARIVSLDPWGADVSRWFAPYFERGFDIRPTIAVTRAHLNMPELTQRIREGLLRADGSILTSRGDCRVIKAAIEPVWYLPGIAARFQISETDLRRGLFEHTGGMFPELITRPDLEVFLPPIGGQTVYLFGSRDAVQDPARQVAVRVHDECNGSDVFGSDICTCRPYLVHGIQVCIETAQAGGVGIIVYNRKEGRALGEVTKFLVYNARKRQEGGDRAESYFLRTECVAGVQDMRFQELMPDTLLWLGVTTIDKLVSMSNMKFDAMVRAGITVRDRIPIPPEFIPDDAKVEMDAKRAAGYFSPEGAPAAEELAQKRGRDL
jgi:GTP cyclohydrolase II